MNKKHKRDTTGNLILVSILSKDIALITIGFRNKISIHNPYEKYERPGVGEEVLFLVLIYT